MANFTNVTKSLAAGIGVIAVGVMLVSLAPSATAEVNDAPAVTSARSFPKVAAAKKDVLAEAVSTSNDGTWKFDEQSDTEIKVTKTQAQKDAETAQAQAQAQKAAQEAAAQAASRSQTRTSTESTSSSSNTASYAVAPPDAATSAAAVSFALQFVGKVPYVAGGNTPAGWDCSGFVQYVFSNVGVALPHSSGAQASVGTAVNGIANALPGDIIATSGHSAIYLGNGQVVNATVPHSDSSKDTVVSLISHVFPNGYSIRRVL